MDILSIIGSILACAIVGLIIVSFWTIFWKFCLYKFPFIQAIVSGDQKGLEGPKTPPTVTPEQAQKEREERIARRRTRKAE